MSNHFNGSAVVSDLRGLAIHDTDYRVVRGSKTGAYFSGYVAGRLYGATSVPARYRPITDQAVWLYGNGCEDGRMDAQRAQDEVAKSCAA